MEEFMGYFLAVLFVFAFCTCAKVTLGDGQNILPVIVPEPYSMEAGNGSYNHQFAYTESEAVWKVADRLQYGAEGIQIDRKKLDELVTNLPDGFDCEQGYIIQIGEKGVDVYADTDAAWFYSLQTLAQVIVQCEEGPLPSLTIIDFPEMSVRGIHACYHLATEWMPLSVPDFESLKELIRVSAFYKMNAVLLELEAMFPYQEHEELACRIAFSRKELEQIREQCADCYMEIVPMHQSLGHAYHVLRHPEYAHLREVETVTQQYCPSDPDTVVAWKKIAGEIAKAYPESRYFHIGGDETMLLGWCPECAEYVKKESMGKLYGRHVGACARAVKDMGLTPIVWTDMMAKHPEAIGEMPEGTEYVYWNYTVPEPPSEIEKFANIGKTWAACAIRFGGQNSNMYPFDLSNRGIIHLAKDAREYGVEKLIATDWMKSVSHELSAFGRAMAAEQSWRGKRNVDEFADAYSVITYGYHLEDLDGIYRRIDGHIPYCEDGQAHWYTPFDRYDTTGLTFHERMQLYTKFPDRMRIAELLESAKVKSEEAIRLIEEAEKEIERDGRSLDILMLAARTNLHKAKLGLAIHEAVPALKFPTKNSAEQYDGLAEMFDKLANEHDELKIETRRLLAPTHIEENLDHILKVKFEPEARRWMEYFALMLRKGETAPDLLEADISPVKIEEK